jgi:hypothetical protein
MATSPSQVGDQLVPGCGDACAAGESEFPCGLASAAEGNTRPPGEHRSVAIGPAHVRRDDLSASAVALEAESRAEQFGGRNLQEGDEQQGTEDGVDGVLKTGPGEPAQQSTGDHRSEVDRDLVVFHPPDQAPRSLLRHCSLVLPHPSALWQPLAHPHRPPHRPDAGSAPPQFVGALSLRSGPRVGRPRSARAGAVRQAAARQRRRTRKIPARASHGRCRQGGRTR